MPITLIPTLVSCLNQKILFTKMCFLPNPKIFRRFIATTSITRPIVLKCNSSLEEGETNNGNLKDALAGMVDQRVEELLNREENKVFLDALEKASLRVEMAKRELAEIEKRELEAKQMRGYVNKLETRAFEIAECQREIVEARAILEEAERSLSQNANEFGVADSAEDKESEGINKEIERWESTKAASISALVGTLAGLPISFTQVTSFSQLLLTSAITFISCALFGVIYRYTIRRDLDNVHLKSGAFGAFGVVKGLAPLSAEPPLELKTESFFSHTFQGAVYVSENLIIFTFAAVALDFSFKTGLLSPYPKKKLASRIDTR